MAVVNRKSRSIAEADEAIDRKKAAELDKPAILRAIHAIFGAMFGGSVRSRFGQSGAVVNTKSSSITNMDAGPPVKVASYLDHGKVRQSVGVCEAANGDSIASVYRFARVHSSWRPKDIQLYCDAITTCAGDVGLYDIASAGGAAILAGAFATAQSLASALTKPESVKFEALNIDQAEKTYWEIAGLTTDPSKHMDVCITLTAAAGSAGTMALEVGSVET